MRSTESTAKRLRTIQICPNPVFIIGSPRSGTTILARSLARHSQLWTSFESDILFSLYANGHAVNAYSYTMKRPWKSWLQDQHVDRAEFLESLGHGVNTLFTSRSEGKRWLDHTLVHTMMADLLAEMFPGAYFIHMLRDGRRVVHSMMNLRQNPSVAPVKPDSEYMGSWTRDFDEACKTWRRYVQAGDRFCASHPTRALTVVNERLATDPSTEMGKILEFLCLPSEDAPGEYFRTNRINSSFQPNATTKTSQPPVDPWVTWSAVEKAKFIQEAGATMVAHGYASADEMGRKGLGGQASAPAGDEPAQQVADSERDRAILDLEQWAHRLEATAEEQQRVIRTYERWFGPFISIGRLVLRFKDLLRDGEGKR